MAKEKTSSCMAQLAWPHQKKVSKSFFKLEIQADFCMNQLHEFLHQKDNLSYVKPYFTNSAYCSYHLHAIQSWNQNNFCTLPIFIRKIEHDNNMTHFSKKRPILPIPAVEREPRSGGNPFVYSLLTVYTFAASTSFEFRRDYFWQIGFGGKKLS